MKPSNDNKPNEDMDSSNEVLFLDQPCEYCKVLELDDTQHGGIVEEAEDGKRFVQFKNPANGKSGLEYQLRLGYRREDTLPGLPNIAATAQTCAFCRMLRSDLKFSYKNLKLPRVNDINGNEDNNHAIQDANITITDVNYMFDTNRSELTNTWDEDGDDDNWLSLLIVFVIID